MSTSDYTGWCVVVFGTASLQRYVFQSNRLKENIGASYLAKHWLSDGLVETTQADTSVWKKYEKNPWRDPPKNPIVEDKFINVIYIGGGNAALLCKNREIAEAAVRGWSRKVLKDAPGLRGVVGYGEVCEHRSLAEAYRDGVDHLNFCEETLPFGTALHSLPIVRSCISTGFPASKSWTEPDAGIQWISQSAASQRDQVSLKGKPGAAQMDIKEKFPSVLEASECLPEMSFAIKLDEELGGRKGESHIAIVHADGNGMTELLNRVIDQKDHGDNEKDQEDNKFLHNLRAFSASTTALSHKALEETLLHFKTFLPLKKSLHNSDDIFPIRPIVFGGDDLTFVCDGRVGLHLAAYYLQQFANGEINVCDSKISVDACAGVAIVPTKFPFARAYGFADELCGLAKRHRREERNPEGSWLDFQIIQEGTTKSITALRDTQYLSLTGQTLHQRPYQVPEKWNAPKKSDTFIQLLKWFQSSKWPRSRVKNLLQALVQGPSATKRFLDRATWRGIELSLDSTYRDGWKVASNNERDDDKKGTTPCYDPLEAIDFYLPELLKCNVPEDDER